MVKTFLARLFKKQIDLLYLLIKIKGIELKILTLKNDRFANTLGITPYYQNSEKILDLLPKRKQ